MDLPHLMPGKALADSSIPLGRLSRQPSVASISSQVDYESQEAKDNSEFQVLWSSIMDKGSLRNQSTYKKVEVLLLCWADGSDDIGPEGEIARLQSVFEKQFGYGTQVGYLDVKVKKKLQIQVNGKVAAFVEAHDAPNTLLIIYYAGHGGPGDHYGEMHIFG